MPANYKACSNPECYVTEYSVLLEPNLPAAGQLKLTLVQTCNTLHDQCRAKEILIKVYRDLLENNNVSTDVMADCLTTNHRCAKGGPGMDFYAGTYSLVVKTPGFLPAATATVNVPLPITCDNVFTP